MTQTIHKWRLNWMGETLIGMSPNADILDVQIQNGEPTMWVQLDPDESTVPRKFVLLPTGAEFPKFEGPYIATVQEGGFVWHVFERYD